MWNKNMRVDINIIEKMINKVVQNYFFLNSENRTCFPVFDL